MDDASTLSELRSLILSKTCIQSITPADCKKIAQEISQTLHRTLSETTIKRIFGFAHSQHNFSKFTLAALTEYVEMHPGHTVYDGWQGIELKAATATAITLNGIKNRAELPFKMTISRDFAALHMEEFQQSDCSFSCFISPPGHGRSILLGHLAEQIKSQQLPSYQNTTLLFIAARDLFEKTESPVVFEEQVKVQLGIHPNESLLQYTELNYAQTGRTLTIFIDGFCEMEMKRQFREELIESIFDFIRDLSEHKSIKLVMSMRSNTWKKYDEEVNASDFLSSKWYRGLHYDAKTYSNVPELNSEEITRILAGIEQQLDYSDELRQAFKIPSNISLYQQIREEKSYLTAQPYITPDDLIAHYVRHKIYRSNYYTEKIHFLRKLVQLTNFGKEGRCAAKDLLITDLSAFRNAYRELLADGILSEHLCDSCKSGKLAVCFSHKQVFEYFVNIELMMLSKTMD